MLRPAAIAFVAALMLLTGCPGDVSRDSSGGSPDLEAAPPDAPGDGATFAGCDVDADCEAVASSCCECPTFALPISEGVGAVCEDVICDALECPEQAAVCNAGACELACAPVLCELSCENGFVQDEAGCSLCECNAVPVAPECGVAADCAQVSSDCCGCSRGGQDTAVPVAEAGGFVDGLGCTGAEFCPEVDLCDADALPTCSYGRCGLVNETLDGLEMPDICGTIEAPTCADGSDCVLNPRDYPMVAAAGLGACVAE